jgi:hypothetical protein
MAIKTPPPSSSGNFDDYVRCLRAEVDAAAKVRWEDPVAFLWRSRRVGEALLHALRVRNVPGSGHDPSASIDGLLKHEQLRAKLGRENLIDLQGLQSLGNTGSHIQGEAINYEHTAGVAAAHLANVVSWFFRTQHAEATVPDDVSRALAILREPARWQSSPDNLARRTEERISHLMGELRAASEAARRGGGGGATDPRATTPPRLSIGRTVLAALGVALPALGGGVALGRGCVVVGAPTPTQVVAPVTVVSPLTGVPDAGAVRDDRATPATDVYAEPSDAGPANCPYGTVEIAARSFDLLPPLNRRGAEWRVRPGNTPRRVDAHRVCLETHVASVREVLAWRGELSSRFTECVARPPDATDSTSMPCLSHGQAAAWCASRGRRLPRLEEWEALGRQSANSGARYVDPPVATGSDLLEWMENPFPPPFLGLASPRRSDWFMTRGVRLAQPGPESARPRYSWNHQLDSNRVHSLFVRCVFDPAAPAR